jgi:hypothetical protein
MAALSTTFEPALLQSQRTMKGKGEYPLLSVL